MAGKIHVHNNCDHAKAIPFTVGDRNQEIRFQPGWNAVDPGPLESVTGGFGPDGRAKGGLAAYLFNRSVLIGKRHLPPLELGTPRDSDDVHPCPAIPGVRRHHRTLKAEKDEQEKLALRLLLERTTRELAALRGGSDGLVEVDLGGGIKARMSLVDAEAYAKRNTSVSEAQVPEPPNPKAMTVAELTEAIGSIEDADTLRAMRDAEAEGKNRSSALAAIDEAIEILEA